MLRLLLTLICGLAVAVTLLMLRQQRLELQHECNALHDEMLRAQTQLWRQQVQIASATAPQALQSVLADHELRRAPEGARPLDSLPPSRGPVDWSMLD